MCLAIPVQVLEIQGPETALVDIGGVSKRINIALVPDVIVGDYVILHVGYALNKIDPEEAQRTLELFAELDELSRQQLLEANR